MKILSNLQAEATDGDFEIPAVHHYTVTDSPVTGFTRSARFGPAGLVITGVTGTPVVIPLAALLALAEDHEPALRIPGCSSACDPTP